MNYNRPYTFINRRPMMVRIIKVWSCDQGIERSVIVSATTSKPTHLRHMEQLFKQIGPMVYNSVTVMEVPYNSSELINWKYMDTNNFNASDIGNCDIVTYSWNASNQYWTQPGETKDDLTLFFCSVDELLKYHRKLLRNIAKKV